MQKYSKVVASTYLVNKIIQDAGKRAMQFKQGEDQTSISIMRYQMRSLMFPTYKYRELALRIHSKVLAYLKKLKPTQTNQFSFYKQCFNFFNQQKTKYKIGS
jgi:hypothetical protein